MQPRLPLPLVLLVPLAALACSAATPPPPAPVTLAPAPAEAPPAPPKPDPASVSVAVVSAPARLVIDGDLAEWGSLLPPVSPAPTPPPAPAPDAGALPDPNPRDAPSHVAVAITPEGALIAAQLAGEAQRGVWLSMDTGAAELAPLGSYARWGVQGWIECMGHPGDESFDPDTDPGCQAVRDVAAGVQRDHAQRFRRVYRIDREGVRALDGKKMVPVEGAKVVSRATPGGAAIEVSLPARALPRVAQAPWTSVSLGARAATTPAPPPDADLPLVTLDLPEPVAPAPWAELRAKLFEAERPYGFAPGLSFQPGDPLHIESMVYPGETERGWLVPRESPIYAKQAAIGDVEIGFVASRRLFVAVLKKGELVELLDVNGKMMGIVERGGELHVVSCYIEVQTDTFTTSAMWHVITVSADGKIRTEAVETEPGEFNWDEVDEHHGRTLDTFGLRGRTRRFGGGEQGHWFDVTWRWDPRTRKYAGRRRDVPAPPKKKPAKRR